MYRKQVCALLLAIASVGCGTRDERVPVFPARGSVFADGKPAERALVIFHPATDPGPNVPRPTGEVQADGTFSLGTYSTGDGAPAGDYEVAISWPGAGSSPIGGDADSGPDRLGSRYLNPKTSGLRAKVDAAATEIPRFQLKSK